MYVCKCVRCICVCVCVCVYRPWCKSRFADADADAGAAAALIVHHRAQGMGVHTLGVGRKGRASRDDNVVAGSR